MNFRDDVGAWNSHGISGKKTSFLVHGKQLLHTHKKTKECVVLHRRYFHHSSENYQKRVSEFNSIPGFQIYEYLGDVPFPKHHGNRKHQGHPYRRTKPAILESIRNAEPTMRPLEIYTDILRRDPNNAPRNLDQVRSTLHRSRIENGQASSQNLSDQVLKIISLLETHPFTFKVILMKSRMPIIILVVPELIDQMARFCSSTNRERALTPLGIDRTFNVASCHVTMTCFKQLDVLRTETHDHPVMLGPVLLHWESDVTAFSEFFLALKLALADSAKELEMLNLPSILFGSDQEKAILSARALIFRESQHLFCVLHLRECLQRFLDKQGFTPLQRSRASDIIFGTFAENPHEDTVNAIMESLTEFALSCPNGKQLIRYFQNHIRGILTDQSVIHLDDSHGQGCWTNNNCESMNFLLKHVVHREIQTVPDLVDKIYSIVDRQLKDLQRAIVSEGEYMLIQAKKKYLMPRHQWLSLPTQEQTAHFRVFLRGKSVQQRIGSSNGVLSLQAVPRIGKKPGSKSRPSSSRTSRRNKRSRLD